MTDSTLKHRTHGVNDFQQSNTILISTLVKHKAPNPPLPIVRWNPSSVLQVARKRLALQGTVGFISLSRRLRSAGYFRRAVASSHAAAVAAAAAAAGTSSSGVIANDFGDNGGESGPFLSLAGFKEVLSEIGCGLSGKDATNVFMHLDHGGRGEVIGNYYYCYIVP